MRLIRNFEDLPSGTEGTIVFVYDGSNFEIKFFDNNGDTIGIYTIEKKYLERV